MKHLTILFAAALITVSTFGAARAQTLYWDTNGTNTGATDAGDGTAPGTWSPTDLMWTTDSTGASATTGWTDNNTAVFSAGTNATGTYTVTLNGTQTVNGLTLEEGNVTLGTSNVGQTITFNPASTVNVAPNTTLTIAATVLGTGPSTITGGGILKLAPAGNTNNQSGPVTVSGGSTLELSRSGDIGATGAGSGDITLDGGTLRQDDPANAAPSFLTPNRNIILTSNGGTVYTTERGPGPSPSIVGIYVYGGNITGGAGTTLHKAGPGEFRVTTVAPVATPVYNYGNLVVDNGLFYVANVSADSNGYWGAAGQPVVINDGGALGGNSTTTTSRNIQLTPGNSSGVASLVVAAAVTWTFNGQITGDGGLRIGPPANGTDGYANSGSTTANYNLNANNTYSGDTTILRGIVNVSQVAMAAGTSATGYGKVTVGDGAGNGFLAGNGNIGHGATAPLGHSNDGLVEVRSGARLIPGIGNGLDHSMNMRGLQLDSGSVLRTVVNPLKTTGIDATVTGDSDYAQVTGTGDINSFEGIFVNGGATYEIRTNPTDTWNQGHTWFTGGTFHMLQYSGSTFGTTGNLSLSAAQSASATAGPIFEPDTTVVTDDTVNKYVNVTLEVVDRKFNNSSTSASWDDTNVWARGGAHPAAAPQSAPNNVAVIAEFTDNTSTNHTITLDNGAGFTAAPFGTRTVGVLNLDSQNSKFTIASSDAVNNKLTLNTINGTYQAQVNDLHGSHEISAPVVMSAGLDNFTVNNAPDTLTISGVISGAGIPIINGPGTVVFSGTNTYTSRTIINPNGVLSISSNANLGATPGAVTANSVTLNGGGSTLKITGTGVALVANRGITVSGASNIVIGNGTAGNSTTLDVQSKITNAASVLTITGGGTYAPTTNVNQSAFTGGKWYITGGSTWQGFSNQQDSGANPASPVANFFTLDNGTYAGNGGAGAGTNSPNVNKGFTIGSGGGTINAFNAGITLGQIITSANGCATCTLTTKAAASKIVTLTGANTYTGGTVVSTGQTTVSGATAKLGTGNVSVLGGTNGTFLSIATGVTNAIADTATLTLAGGGTAGTPDAGYIDLGAGVNETVASLVLVGLGAQAPGTYGGTGSSAAHILPEYFAADTGIITVPSVTAPGDFNGDGNINAADYVTWRKNDGTAAGYTAFRQNFQPSPIAGSSLDSASVPEPASVVLLLLGFAGLAGRRRRTAA